MKLKAPLILRIVQRLVQLRVLTTNLMPDTEQISINQITISNKLDAVVKTPIYVMNFYCFLKILTVSLIL